MTKSLPSAEFLHECFAYDPDTGVISWKNRPRHHFTSDAHWKKHNTRFAGRPTGCKQYTARKTPSSLHVSVLGHPRSVHRVIWKMIYRDEPSLFIDHVNGDPFDNRLCNLRLSSHSSNQWNRGATKRNKSGFKGVSWSKKRSMWKVGFHVGEKNIHFGYFELKCLAAVAAAKGSLMIHGKFSEYYRQSA
jgi:hypothetical protein